MTNTTREFTFRNEARHTLLRVLAPVHSEPGSRQYAMQLTTRTGDNPVWSLLTGDQVEELRELTGLILAGRKLEYGDDGVQDARIVCGAYLEELEVAPGVSSPRAECCLDDAHGPVAGNSWKHVTSDGVLFELPPF